MSVGGGCFMVIFLLIGNDDHALGIGHIYYLQ
eukprot:COSAG03_NODE_780_length_5888_cov_2.083607_2_plen_32_part_00